MKSFDETWEKIHSTREWGQYPSESVIRYVARNFYKSNPRKAVKILDFGCGGGANTWYLLREGFDTYAFDGSKSAIENTRHKLENEFGECRANLRVRDALDLDYEKDFFDGILDNFCIYANKRADMKSMFSECYSMLKAGGKIYTAGFGFETEGYGQGKKIEENTFQDIPIGRLQGVGTVHFYDDKEIKGLLEEAGFKNIQTDSNIYTDMGHKVHIWSTIAEK